MAGSRRKLASCLLALAAAISSGCLPRGPFPPATLFGEREHPDCDNDGSCRQCRRAGHRDHGGTEGGDAASPPMMAPISNFNPVPTRPVFTPWSVEAPVPEEISGPLAWKHAVNRPVASAPAKESPAVEQPSSTPVARRTLPVPANLPDEKPVLPTDDKRAADTPADQSPSGWHAASPRF